MSASSFKQQFTFQHMLSITGNCDQSLLKLFQTGFLLFTGWLGLPELCAEVFGLEGGADRDESFQGYEDGEVD